MAQVEVIGISATGRINPPVALGAVYCSLASQKKNGPCKLPYKGRFGFFKVLELICPQVVPEASKINIDYLQPHAGATGAAHPQPEDGAGAHPPPQALPLIAPQQPEAAGTDTGTVTV